MLHPKQAYIQQEKFQRPQEDNNKLHGYWMGNSWLDIISPAPPKKLWVQLSYYWLNERQQWNAVLKKETNCSVLGVRVSHGRAEVILLLHLALLRDCGWCVTLHFNKVLQKLKKVHFKKGNMF